MSTVYKIIGLMSGTSCDGIDAAYIETDGEDVIKLGHTLYLPYSDDFANKLVSLTKGDKNHLAEIELELTKLHAKAVLSLLQESGESEIDYLGFHGHTIEHNPKQKITHQIGDIKLLSELTKTSVVGDFRSNDVNHGGEGAPLVPIFLKGLTSDLTTPTVYLNIGGVANLTYVSADDLIAFDTGPGNALINDVMHSEYGARFDENGKLAASGMVEKSVLEDWLKHPYFAKKYPKSLDRNTFLDIKENHKFATPNDCLATLTEFTCQSIKLGIDSLPTKPTEIIVYGGGRKNTYMMDRLSSITGIKITDISSLGIDGDFIEAYAFGYLAARCVKKLPISFPNTTNTPTPLSGGMIKLFLTAKLTVF